LSEAERDEIVEALLASSDDEPSADIDSPWKREIDRRLPGIELRADPTEYFETALAELLARSRGSA
jgi:hypothetical protein